MYILWLSILLLGQVPRGQVKMTLEAIEDYGIYTKTEILELKNINASEVEPFVMARLSRFGAVQVNDMLNALIITDYEPKLKDIINLIKKLDERGVKEFVRLETEIIPVKFVPPSSIAPSLESRLSADGSIQANDDLNVLIVTDVQSKIEDVKRILNFLDIPPAQVILYAKVIEMEEEYARELGLDIYGIIEGVDASYNYRKYRRIETNYTSETEDIYANIGIRGEQIVPNIEQLISEGTAEVISGLNIKLLNNKEGTIQFPPYFGLAVIPQIGSDGDITLKLTFSKSTGNDLVSGADNEFSTTVRVRDGDTLTIGGIKVEDVTKETSGIPLLKDIPILGYLFKRETNTRVRKNIAVLITPRIIE